MVINLGNLEYVPAHILASYIYRQFEHMKYIGLDLNTNFKFRLPETFSRYKPRPQPVLQALM